MKPKPIVISLPALLAAFKAKAVTVGGLLLFIGIATVTLCLLLYVKKKALNAAEVIQRQRELAHSNAVDLAQAPVEQDGNRYFYLDTPNTVWTEHPDGTLTADIPNAEFLEALAGHREWAILFSAEIGGPWIDIGRREWGNPYAIRQLLLQQVNYEGRMIGVDHGHYGSLHGFYRAVPVEEIDL